MLIFAVFYFRGGADSDCYHYVENLVDNANLYNLDEYADYNMLNRPLKKYIDEDDLHISSDEDIWELAQKIQETGYKYNKDKNVYSTAQFKHGCLYEEINIDGVWYSIGFVIKFTPTIYPFKPEVVELSVSIRECTSVN